MSPAGERLWSTIRTAQRSVRRDAVIATAAAIGVLIPVVLLVSWLLAGAAVWSAPGHGPLVVEALALVAALAVLVRVGRRWLADADEVRIAAAAESWRGLPAGSVRGLLELAREVPRGGSVALARRAESALARELAGATTRDLSGSVGVRARSRRARLLLALAVLTGAVLLLGFMTPDRSRAGWTPLLNPISNLSPPPMPPLVVEPGDAEVPRGGDLEVQVGAPERTEVMVRWRGAGDVTRHRRLAVADGRASTRLERIDAPLVYWVVAPDGARSDTFHVRPLDPLLVSDLVVDVVYPSYLAREPERFEGDVPPLAVPEGTELVLRGRATRPLDEAGLRRRDGGNEIRLSVMADRFEGRWTPRRSGTYEWRMRDTHGDTLAESPAELELRLQRDEPPEVEITFPGVDTVLSADMAQPLVADARDDHGLVSATLVSWRVSGSGRRDPAVEQPIELSGRPERAVLRPVLDARDRGLLPGDTLFYFIRVADISPARQTAQSRTYRLRVPGLGELRERAADRARDMMDEATSLARAARQLETQTRDMSRQAARARGGSDQRTRPTAGGDAARGGDGAARSMEYRDAERARQAAEGQQELVDRVSELRERTEQLDEAARASGLRDPDLQRRLQELKQLYDQLMTPELKDQLDELRAAADERDPDRVQRALERLAEEQKEFREGLEQSIELLQRAAVEQEMNRLAQELRELAAQQEALAESIRREEDVSPERAEQQKELEQRAETLRRSLEELRQELERQGEDGAASQAAGAHRQLEDAGESMRQAREDAERGQGESAGEKGKQAAEELEAASNTLDAARRELAEAWRREVEDAVERATQEALALAQRQQELVDRMDAMESGEAGAGAQQPGGDPSGEQPGGEQGGQQPGGEQPGGEQGGQQPGGEQPGGEQDGQAPGGAEGGQQPGGDQGGDQPGGDEGGGEQGGGRGDGAGDGSDEGSGERGRGEQGGGDRGGDGAGGQAGGELEALRSEQRALQEGLEALGRNLAEMSQKTAHLDREVGAALGQAMQSMQETLESLGAQAQGSGLPKEQAGRSVDALNRLAMALLENAQRIREAETGTGLREALERLAELAKEQSSLNAQASSLLPLDLAPEVMAEQMERLAREQRQIAGKLGGLNDAVSGHDDVLGQIDELMREAEQLARELSGGRLTPEMLARQEQLFHRLLDAGYTLERDEITEQRVAERPGAVGVSRAAALDPALVDTRLRFPLPGPEELRRLPAAYRRMILEYFDRLNRTADVEREGQRP